MEDLTDITDKKQIAEKPWLFQKGQSGNPNGRPKGSISLLEILRKELEEIPSGQLEQRRNYAELLIKRMLHKAINEGDIQAQKLIMNYVEGLPYQPINLGVDREGLAELTQFMRELASKKDE